MNTITRLLTVISLIATILLIGLLSEMFGLSYSYKHRGDAPKMLPLGEVANPLLHKPLVRLYNSDDSFFCSGTVISPNYILTAAHCLAPQSMSKNSIKVKNDLGLLVTTASVADFENRSDQGLLYGDFSSFNNVEIELNSGMIITAFEQRHVMIQCGFPYGGNPLCLEFKPIRRAAFSVAGDSWLYPGMSGGPTIDLMTGKIIAINTAVDDYLAIISPVVEIMTNLHIEFQ